MNNLKGLFTKDHGAVAYVYRLAIPGEGWLTRSWVERLFRGRTNRALSHRLGLKADVDSAQQGELRRYAEEHFAAGLALVERRQDARAGTASCVAPHFQYHVSGQLAIRMDDGTE